AVGEAARRPARTRDDLSASPIEDVAGGVHDRKRGHYDVAELEARGAHAALHPAEAAAPMHLSHGRPRPRADAAFGHGSGGSGRARLVGRLRVRPDAGVADGEVVDHRRDDERDADIGYPPVEAGLVLLEIADHTT